MNLKGKQTKKPKNLQPVYVRRLHRAHRNRTDCGQTALYTESVMKVLGGGRITENLAFKSIMIKKNEESDRSQMAKKDFCVF